MLVPNTNTRARCTGDDESAPKTRDSTRRRCIALLTTTTTDDEIILLGFVTVSASSSPFARQASATHQCPRALTAIAIRMAEGSSTAMEVDDAPHETSHKQKTREAQIASLPWVEKCAGAMSLSLSLCPLCTHLGAGSPPPGQVPSQGHGRPRLARGHYLDYHSPDRRRKAATLAPLRSAGNWQDFHDSRLRTQAVWQALQVHGPRTERVGRPRNRW